MNLGPQYSDKFVCAVGFEGLSEGLDRRWEQWMENLRNIMGPAMAGTQAWEGKIEVHSIFREGPTSDCSIMTEQL